MTDLQDIIDAVARDPDTDILAAFLVDELMTVKDMNRTEADRHVESYRETCRVNQKIDRAAALLASSVLFREFVRREVRERLSVVAAAALLLTLVGGPAGPRYTGVRLSPSNSQPAEASVTLGAEWVLALYPYWFSTLDPKTQRKVKKREPK